MRSPSFALLMLAPLALTACALAAPVPGATAVPDWRHLSNGSPIPGESYCDQPYIVRTEDGAWLCVMTTAPGEEGSTGQHVITVRSTDHGRTWSKPVSVEPPGPPEASYAVLLKVPGGRIYCFYNHNTDNVREVKREDQGVYQRVDSLGHFVFRFSEDHGRTWSARRYEIPVREFEIDRKNIYGGKLRFFWNVGRPLVAGDAAYVPLHKVGAMGAGFFAQSEGAFLRSDNLLTERDPEKIRWSTLPEGEIGLRTPPGGGRIAEEQSLTALSDGSLFCVYRSVDGHPVAAFSRDGGRTWTPPRYHEYAPGGRRFKHSRAANFVWRCGNGKFLYWFHNHGGPSARRNPAWDPYADRNPAWIVAGEEKETPQGRVLVWSQPEVLLYDDDPLIRMSYPDLVEEEGRFWVTETQKNLGRVHALDGRLLDGLFSQSTRRTEVTEGKLTDVKAPGMSRMGAPRLPLLVQRDTTRPDHAGKDLRQGFTLDLWLRLETLAPGQVLLDTMGKGDRGLELITGPNGSLRFRMSDGRTTSQWDSDAGQLTPGKRHHVVVTVDGGPKIITYMVDGLLNDGGDQRQFGWGRFNPHLQQVNSTEPLTASPGVERLRIYGRALRTSEAVANFRAEQQVQ